MQKFAGPSGVKRVALVLAASQALGGPVGPLLRELAHRRHRTLVLAPDWPAEARALVEQLGAEWAAVPIKGLAPRMIADFSAVRGLTRALAAFRPHAVAGFGVKASMLAAIAARAADAHRVVGVLVDADPLTRAADPGDAAAAGTGRVIDPRWRRLARRGFAASDTIVVGSEETRRRLAAHTALPHDCAVVVLPAMGVDLATVVQQPLPPLDHGLVFLLAATVGDTIAAARFAAAAEHFSARAGCRFVVPPAPSELAASIAAAHVVVAPVLGDLPPPGLLEALAIGRPVVLVPTGFARELVDDRVNGCLAADASGAGLAAAMDVLVRRPDLIPAMARAARLKAERRFDQREIAAAMLDLLGVAQMAG